MNNNYDIAVIGGGIAGASVACKLAGKASVALLEMESQPGYHTTGRSAALFIETYGPPAIRALTRASAAFFRNPPEGFSDTPLVSPRGVLMVSREDQLEELDALVNEVGKDTSVSLLDAAETRALAPLLKQDYIARSMYEPSALDMDVNALHQGYLRKFRKAGGMVKLNSRVTGLTRHADHWVVTTDRETFRAGIIVNASGAWADELGQLAGAVKIGMVPKRRTMIVIPEPEGYELAQCPMIVDISEEFYLKHDAGRLLISPADETPSPACDAQPDEMDIAVCVDRIEKAFDMQIRRLENSWAGLRCFVPDKCPVCGFDPEVEGYFWLAALGGYGIQTSPALSDYAASQVLGEPIPDHIASQGFNPVDVGPTRFSS